MMLHDIARIRLIQNTFSIAIILGNLTIEHLMMLQYDGALTKKKFQYKTLNRGCQYFL